MVLTTGVKMKNNFRRLHLFFLITGIDPAMFYCITVYETYINLQGNFTPLRDIKSIQKQLNKKTSFDRNGILTVGNDNVKIILT